jgi:hypothetical protein
MRIGRAFARTIACWRRKRNAAWRHACEQNEASLLQLRDSSAVHQLQTRLLEL